MKQKQLFFFLVLTLLALSLLNWVEAKSIWMWQLSVLTLEWGHFFAILCLVLLFTKIIRRAPTAIVAAVFLIPATCGFLKPVFQSFKIPQGKFVTAKTLFFGRSFDKVSPKTVNYMGNDNERQTLDYYAPTGAPNGAWILVVHGGGWSSGDLKQLPELNSLLANQGYAVFSMNYRLAPEFKWPAQKEDTMAAINYIREHASDMNLKPDSWMILGRSAGAQIAAATAYSLSDQEKPKAVVMLYGPTEMTFGYEVGSIGDILESRDLLKDFLGGTPYEAKTVYDDASPMLMINEKTPPTLLIYGEFDYLVWHKHGERLYERLKLLNVPTDYVRLPWATHGFDFNINGPGGQISTTMIEKYLNEFVLNR